MREHFSDKDQINNLREIQALKRLNPHNNIIQLREVIFEKSIGREYFLSYAVERKPYFQNLNSIT